MSSTDSNLLHRISKHARSLPPSMKRVAEVILSNPSRAQTLSISQLAAEAKVADSTVSRFMRELGIDGYKALMLEISQAVYASPTSNLKSDYVYEGILKGDKPDLVLQKALSGSVESLTKTAASLNPETLKEVIKAIEKAKTIYFVAMGSSAISAENAIMRFVRAGKRCFLFRDQSIQIMAAATLEKTDLLIAISDSGESTSVVNALKVGKIHGAKTVAITSNATSPLANGADFVLLTSAPSSNSSVYGETMTAKWGQMFAIDALYAAYAASHYEETIGFLEESYLSGIKGTRA